LTFQNANVSMYIMYIKVYLKQVQMFKSQLRQWLSCVDTLGR
jgi:hypothetical protein